MPNSVSLFCDIKLIIIKTFTAFAETIWSYLGLHLQNTLGI